MNDDQHYVDKRLDLWLEEQFKKQPDQSREVNFFARYIGIREYLRDNIHKEIASQAMLGQLNQDAVPHDQIIYLTHHGVDHVEQVVTHASKLLKVTGCKLTTYEVYLLLTAIQLHDVGNVFERENHEKRIAPIIAALGKRMGDDRPEKRTILRIAAAHSGDNNGDRDTIGVLEAVTYLQGQKIRQHLLAAILRFSDELADDKNRASCFCLKEGLIPEASKLYHTYSTSLHPVVLDSAEVMLKYEFDRATALRTFNKGGLEIFLLDEIYDRTLKMHLERSYCMRFLLPEVPAQIKRISVKIEVYSSFDDRRIMDTPIVSIGYNLEEMGYPVNLEGGIAKLCPDLDYTSGQKLSKILSEGEDR